MEEPAGWWAGTLIENLSQGDIVTDQAAVIAAHPTTYLKSVALKHGRAGWEEHTKPVESNGRTHLLATGSIRAALVVSHDCELDKDEGNPARRRVLIAPAYPLSSVSEEHQEQIRSQANKALMPLPAVPGVGDLYADLRSMCSVPRMSVDAAQRLASMTELSRLRLRAQLVAFFLRAELD